MTGETFEGTTTFTESLQVVMGKAEEKGILSLAHLHLFGNIIIGLASLPPPEMLDVIRSASSPLVTVSNSTLPEETRNLFSFHYRQKGSTEVRLIVTPPLVKEEDPPDQYSLLLLTQDDEIQAIQIACTQEDLKTLISYSNGEWTITNSDLFVNTKEQALGSLAFLSNLVQPASLHEITESLPDLPPLLWKSLLQAYDMVEQQELLSPEESNMLFLLLIMIYDLPSPQLQASNRKISAVHLIPPNPQLLVRYQGAYTVTRNEGRDQTRCILIPYEQTETVSPEQEQIEITLETDIKMDDTIKYIRLRYSTSEGHIILEYTDQAWQVRSDQIPWEIMRRTFLLNLEKIVLYFWRTLHTES